MYSPLILSYSLAVSPDLAVFKPCFLIYIKITIRITVGVIKIALSSKKVFEISPIFYNGLECQLFMLMTFVYSRKQLICKLDTFF
jgi:hypothetical protein